MGLVRGLEATIENLHLRTVSGAIEGIGHPHAVHQQEAGGPAIAGED